jgi:hypothetical protein
MKLLRFPSKEAVVSSPCARRLRTRCESCGEPTVVQDRVVTRSACDAPRVPTSGALLNDGNPRERRSGRLPTYDQRIIQTWLGSLRRG